jgi:hypothetical protein
MMDESVVHFLRDFADLLYERAREARERCEQLKKISEKPNVTEFECGRALGYYEVVSLFVSQAKIFGIPSDIIKLTTIDPDHRAIAS